MPKKEPYFFVSYSRHDHNVVEQIVGGLRERNVNIWRDTESLVAGQNWERTIKDALQRAAGLLIFVSQASMDSAFVRREIEAVAASPRNIIIPVVLENISADKLPAAIARFNWLMLENRDARSIQTVTDAITDAIAYHLRTRRGRAGIVKGATKLAATIAQEKRQEAAEKPSSDEVPKSVFIVHGRDSKLLADIKAHVQHLGVEAIVLTEIYGAEKSLLQKFLTWSKDVKFAIVLLSADDFGASREQYDAPDVADRALQFRARQNVILELGFFYGLLGWENVFVVFKKPDKVFPNFERPSDLEGVIFDSIDEAGRWMKILTGRLREAGFRIEKDS